MATLQWYAVKATLPRTGRTQVEYVQASSAQQATQTFAGSTLLGGPYTTEAAAQAAFPQGSAGSVPAVAGQTVPPTVSNAPIANPLGALTAIGDFFGRLTESSTWLRLAEGLLGLGLVIIGLAKLASGTSIGHAATKIGKAAAIL